MHTVRHCLPIYYVWVPTGKLLQIFEFYFSFSASKLLKILYCSKLPDLLKSCPILINAYLRCYKLLLCYWRISSYPSNSIIDIQFWGSMFLFLRLKIVVIFSKNVSIFSLILFYILLGFAFGIFTGCVEYHAYCTFKNPDKINYAKFLYNEIPASYLIIMPQVRNFAYFFVFFKFIGQFFHKAG
jgi:hypothetical protein